MYDNFDNLFILAPIIKKTKKNKSNSIQRNLFI